MIRFRAVFWLLFLSFALIIIRFYQLQILNVAQGSSEDSFIKFDKKISLRGEIYDLNENPLVLNRQTFDVFANTQDIKKNDKIQKKLRQVLKIKEASLSAFLKKGEWQKIKDNISTDKRAQLLKYYPRYLNFEEEWLRYYPEGSSSAYILGFLGKNDLGEPQGYIGLEGYLNQELQGLPIINENESDLLGVPFIGGIMSNRKDRAGLDLHLTVDKKVQQMVEVELKDGLERFQAKSACAIVMEPFTGEIMALTCLPAFDPQKYYQFEAEDFVNPAVAQVYEPGSTFKPLIVAIGLENNRFKKNTVVPEPGPYRIGEYSIATWNNQYRGRISVEQTLAKSSNVGMVELIKKIPQKETDQYFDKLGLRSLTGIELEGEALSLIKSREQWYPIDYLTYSFGQGLAVTPVQLIRAFATLANGGLLVKPTLIKSYYDSNSHENVALNKGVAPRVFSEKTVKQMKKLLLTAVNASEAHWPNKPENYAICGKTGTAQIAIAGSYDPTHTVASFIGFLPCDRPKFITLVMYREPKSSPWGSETAAPTFFEIANKLILYYNIAPK
ncbi:hypothetical protein A2403_02540 [Candidatus Roizmanbacteria bacterium RIFOXYC1_FULL_41_16]|nr:MAG: hypothetical protein A2612_01455 [Candidatus Moranbacteria bacterium RIFOXYD1_FULL_44_12]OGK67169.1 MAG: hypothetical protein A2377_00845 [Candidatus Roizmanbacteria bacterium RIFOXYB1_FULL_41_27]OGK71102.1 MAG: hypothetical protein A2403_02540 [Candidatus Roizmanbacteria bacterium RIFOXYC1_FULL_41_16]